MAGTTFSGLRRELTIQRLLPSITAGMVIVLIDITVNISLAALIFSGLLSGFIANGIGFFLFGSLVFSLVVSIFSSYSGAIAIPQDATAVILALIAAGIGGSLVGSASDETIFLTAIAAISLTTLLTGGLFLVLGYFKLGNLVRFIPYPVIGGFLAGTGWLLSAGGLGVMAGSAPTLTSLPDFFTNPTLLRWLPGALFGLLLLVTLRRYSHYLIVPGLVVLASVVFYLILWMSGLSIPQAIQGGFLLEPFPGGTLWSPVHLLNLGQVQWTVIMAQASSIAICCLIATLSLLLNASSLELAINREIDLNQELRAAGLSNFLASLGGSPIGYVGLGFSVLNQKIGGGSRITGIVIAGLFAIVLFFGAPVLQLFPKPILGGLLFYLGLAFLAEWLYDGWSRLTRSDYLIVLAIMITMSIWGPLTAVGLGITLAAGLFVVKYSQVKVVKHALSGETFHSTVDRSAEQRALLRRNGGQIQIFELQGYIFFGTSQNLLENIRKYASDQARRSRYLLVDFRRVSGCDSSAIISFQRLAQLAAAHQFLLIFTHLPVSISSQCQAAGLLQNRPESNRACEKDSGAGICTFQTLDHGVEWCENLILKQEGLIAAEAPEPLPVILKKNIPPDLDPERLLKYLDRLEVDNGYMIMRQGEAADALYFLESGSATIYLEMPDGQVTRLTSLRSGSFVGEIGYYTREARTASVMVLEPSIIYRLTYDQFEKLQVSDADIAAALHRWLATLLAERVSDNVKIIGALSK